MRLAKTALFGLMLFALGAMWLQRGFVVDAYTLDVDRTDVRLEGVDLAVQQTDVGPSPYSAAAAPDVRLAPIPALYVDPGVDEPPVVEMSGGTATLTGTVSGPEGPAVGGLVRVERHTAEGIGTVDVSIGPDGRWTHGELPGGRYRLRAFAPGRLAMTHSEVLFLDEEGSRSFDFVLGAVDPQPLIDFVHGGPMYDGLTGSVAVSVSQRTVDADGRIVILPIPGALVTLQTGREVSVVGGPSQVTDGEGAARFTLRCNRVGSGGVVVSYGHVRSSFALPGCRPIPNPEPIPVPTPPPSGQPGGTDTSVPSSPPASTPSTAEPSSGPTNRATAPTTSAPVTPTRPAPATTDRETTGA